METFEFNLDQKVTTWYRTNFQVEAETLEEAKEKAIQLYQKDELDEFTWEQIDGTEEIMTIEDNGNYSTAEIYTDDGKIIFDNAKLSYPFKQGDDYYIIEDGEVMWSCWDDVSEELYKSDKKYFATEEEAQKFLDDNKD
jgi:hypothetical protein